MAAACSRRSLTSGFTHITSWFRPSCAHLLPRADRDGYVDVDRPLHPSPSSIPSPSHTYAVCSSSPHPALLCSAARFTVPIGNRRGLGCSLPLGLGASPRWYSSRTGGANDVEYMKDMADVFTEKGVDVAGVLTEKSLDVAAVAAQAAGPMAGEVAVAAADSAFPVAALQHLIDAVHSFTGLNWWAAIPLTTLLIRTATVPLLINGMKASTKLNAWCHTVYAAEGTFYSRPYFHQLLSSCRRTWRREGNTLLNLYMKKLQNNGFEELFYNFGKLTTLPSTEMVSSFSYLSLESLERELFEIPRKRHKGEDSELSLCQQQIFQSCIRSSFQTEIHWPEFLLEAYKLFHTLRR